MKILVPVKRVMDPDGPVSIEPDGRRVMFENVPHAMNPFDEVALSEAAAIKRQFPDLIEQIIAVSIGALDVEETLRTALAMGADRAIHLIGPRDLEPLAIAKLLKTLVEDLKPDMVLMGNQSVDGDNAQVGPMLAGLLDWPQACNAVKILIDPQQVPEDGFGSVGPGLARMLLTKEEDEARLMIITREVEEGEDSLVVRLPALVTCNLHLNDPQPLGLTAVMKAKRQTIEQRPVAEFPDDIQPRLDVLRLFEPAARAPCKFLPDTTALAARLTQEDAP